MRTTFQWFAAVAILGVAIAGGWVPFVRREAATAARAFPVGQAFSAGVFLALSLTMMLPAGFALLDGAFPGAHFPIASVVAVAAFAVLLGAEHAAAHAAVGVRDGGAASLVPLVMAAMIVVPSFLLGAALGAAALAQAVVVFLAVAVHKGSAGFALALKLVRSPLSRRSVLVTYAVFACATPLGVLAGAEVDQYLAGTAMAVAKGLVFSLAAGTFLYLSTLHEMHHTPLIEDCGDARGFAAMLAGFALTALVRLLVGEVLHA